MTNEVLNISDVFKIGGLAGVVTFFFYLIVKLVIAVIGDLTKMQKMVIVIIILSMAFSLSAFGMFIYFNRQVSGDGGRQSMRRVEITGKEWQIIPVGYRADCDEILQGNFGLWMSFNDDRPYYFVHDDRGILRVVLTSLDEDKANFVVNSPEKLIVSVSLKKGEHKDFSWKSCTCRLTFIGKREENAGWRYLFRVREIADYRLEVIGT